MRLVIQRVSAASVLADGNPCAEIGAGLVVLLGIGTDDNHSDAEWLLTKLLQMRIFADAEGKMNLSLLDVGADLLIISQFTLFADTKKGNRPSFVRAARPELAIPLYEFFLSEAEKKLGKPVARGVFGADMKVSLVNDGPVTICMDSQQRE